MKPETISQYREIANALDEWMPDNFKRHGVNLDDFVATQPYSRRQVQRALAHQGISWREYLTHDRMAEASRLLLANQVRSVASIARAVGYSQPSQFTRSFTEHFGARPLEYRRNGGVRSGSGIAR